MVKNAFSIGSPPFPSCSFIMLRLLWPFAGHAPGLMWRVSCDGTKCAKGGSARQGEVKRRSAVQLPLCPYTASMAVNDAPHMSEPNAGALEFLIAVETLKDPEQILG